MPDRHQHDVFIWALIFSMIINLLIVVALVTQRNSTGLTRLQSFTVSIVTNRTTLPAASTTTRRAQTVFSPLVIKNRASHIVHSSAKQTSTEPVLRLPVPEIKMTGDQRSPIAEAEGKNELPPSAMTTGVAAIAPVPEGNNEPAMMSTSMAGDHYSAPELLSGEKPDYPPRAKRNGWEGTVILAVSININGQVERVDVVETSGYDLLDRSACNTASHWRFKPAYRGGTAVAETVHLPIIFRSAILDNN